MGAKSAVRQSWEREGGALPRGVLEFINKARRALKMGPIHELPRGTPEKSRLCVLARALRCEVLLDEEDAPFALITEYRKASMVAKAWRMARPQEAWNGWSVPLPPELRGFVHEFDAGRHPELVIRDVRAQLGAAKIELEALRRSRHELRSLRLHAMRTQARASVLIAQGRELCLRSFDVCATAREITKLARSNASEIVRSKFAAASFNHRASADPALAHHPSLGPYKSDAGVEQPLVPVASSPGMSVAQPGL